MKIDLQTHIFILIITQLNIKVHFLSRFFYLFLLSLIWVQSLYAQEPDTLLIENISIIDVKNLSVNPRQSILISEGLIVDIDYSYKITAGEHYRKIDGSGKYVLPGLIDGHTHLSANQNRKEDLQAMLKSGITSVRDMGGNAMVYKKLQSDADAEGTRLPDIYFSATVFGPSYMIDPRVKFAAGSHEPGKSPWMRLIEPDSDIKQIVSDAKKAGATGIKLYSSITPEQIITITKEANQQGLMIWGHATIFPSKPSDFVQASPDGITHALSLAFEVYEDVPNEFNDAIRNWLPQNEIREVDEQDERFSRIFEQMKERGIIFEPTISAWEHTDHQRPATRTPTPANIEGAASKLDRQAIVDWNRRITARAIEEGVNISAGTDQTVLIKWIQDEIIFLTELGLTPLQALKAATLTNAELLGIDNQTGWVEVGKRADLVILNQNPVDRIFNIWDVHTVLKAGNIVDL